MSKFNDFLEMKVMPFAGRLAAQRHLVALRDGIILTMPLIIVGSLFLILGNLPIPGYADFMANIFGESWNTKLQYPVNVTFDVMAIFACFGIAYRLAQAYESDGVDPLSSGAIALAAFLLATPFSPFEVEGAAANFVPVSLLGSGGLFVGMLVAMLATEVYRFIVKRNIVIRMPDGVPPAVSRSFIALIPGFAVIILVWLIRLAVEATPFGDIHNLISTVIGSPLTLVGTSLIGSIIAELMVVLLWVCGLHGANIVGGIMSPIWLKATAENATAFAAGQELPHIFTAQFFEVFINVGGSGATLGLVLMMVWRAKLQQNKQLSKLATGPALFNINEPIIFGLPIVLNPLMIIPFVTIPILMVITTYVGMSLGLVAKPAGIVVPWTMPPIISGYLATGGKLSGAVMQLINLAMAMAIYYPFFRILEKNQQKEEEARQRELAATKTDE
ncbi:PTS cellobiose transporter subunit IIC [Terribacillus halophilus]|uniref:PTS cellobiose transporter subunit IIC n=1 Tax=Terribacillus halophilus TaxID=361279 RepID=UPI000986052C|nr:PTS cellobiose transporter subunit IIC [Terribacillus halophilus]